MADRCSKFHCGCCMKALSEPRSGNLKAVNKGATYWICAMCRRVPRAVWDSSRRRQRRLPVLRACQGAASRRRQTAQEQGLVIAQEETAVSCASGGCGCGCGRWVPWRVCTSCSSPASRCSLYAPRSAVELRRGGCAHGAVQRGRLGGQRLAAGASPVLAVTSNLRRSHRLPLVRVQNDAHGHSAFEEASFAS